LFILLILIVGGVLAYNDLTHGGASNGLQAGTTTVIPAGDTIQLPPSSYTSFKATFQNSVRVTGSFSTSYSVALYIMTPSQYAAISSGAGFLQYVAIFSANKGQGPPTAVNWSLQQGEYYFVVANPWPIQSSFTTSDGIEASS
jgi:hypothetical protein